MGAGDYRLHRQYPHLRRFRLCRPLPGRQSARQKQQTLAADPGRRLGRWPRRHPPHRAADPRPARCRRNLQSRSRRDAALRHGLRRPLRAWHGLLCAMAFQTLPRLQPRSLQRRRTARQTRQLHRTARSEKTAQPVPLALADRTADRAHLRQGHRGHDCQGRHR